MQQKTRPRGRIGLSAAALLLCLTLVAGTSYAWMQYTLTSRGNQIRAADFDLGLNTAQLAFDGAWAPGSENTTTPVTITNTGSVAAQCRLSLTALEGDSELTERLELWLEINGTAYPVTPGEDFSLLLPQPLAAGESLTLVLHGSCAAFPDGAAISALWLRGMTLSGGTLTVELVQEDGDFAALSARN